MGDLKSRLARPYRLLRRNTTGKASTASSSKSARPTPESTTTTSTSADHQRPDPKSTTSSAHHSHANTPTRRGTDSTTQTVLVESLESSLVRDFGDATATTATSLPPDTPSRALIDGSIASLQSIPSPPSECPELLLQEPSPEVPPGSAKASGGSIVPLDLTGRSSALNPNQVANTVATTLPNTASSAAGPPAVVARTPIRAGADADTDEDDLLHHEADDEANPLPRQSPRLSPRLGVFRKQSLVTRSNAPLARSLLESGKRTASPLSLQLPQDYFSVGPHSFNMGGMKRKIWVKRPGASATQVQIQEEDLVDDVRDVILKKYHNSLGRSFDAPDVILRIAPRDATQRGVERVLGPEEEMCRTLDAYYPGGQTVDEALLIDVPQRRTPKPSPRPHHAHAYYPEEYARPVENGSEYFPPMPAAVPSPAALTNNSHDSHQSRSISVLNTGQIPPIPLPSPGARSRSHQHQHPHRPRAPRQHTSSPTAITGLANSAATSSSHLPSHTGNPRQSTRPRLDSASGKHELVGVVGSGVAALPTPPAASEVAPLLQTTNAAATALANSTSRPTTPRLASPRPRRRKPKPSLSDTAYGIPAGLLDNSVPPINVLIVEDNIINLKLLEAFMKRLKVRWQTAMNGREAVNKWRNPGGENKKGGAGGQAGGAGMFHLVLMDIQLPVMSGLEATKEIRRLERSNGIGVFSSEVDPSLQNNRKNQRQQGQNGAPLESSGNATAENGNDEAKKDSDKLPKGVLFKSPVIIVALTASSLQSDRHEALAAGCNDFLTKPVNFVWLERKVREWGCMQALIDYDGWRKWKDFDDGNNTSTPSTENKMAKALLAGKKGRHKALAESSGDDGASSNVEGSGSS